MSKELVLLVGPQGCGKTTYCKNALSDYFRISQDDMGKHQHLEIFKSAIQDGKPKIVVDRINHTKAQRARYASIAESSGYNVRIVLFKADFQLCLNRIQNRSDHPTLCSTHAEDALKMYFREYEPPHDEFKHTTVIKEPFVGVKDLTEELAGKRYIIIGDIHGCYNEMCLLLEKMGFGSTDILIGCGDLFDRGPKNRLVLDFCHDLYKQGRFHMVIGNHDDKAIRFFHGNRVSMHNGFFTTHREFKDKPISKEQLDFFHVMPYIIKIPLGYVVHGGFDPKFPPERQKRSDCMFMRYLGGKDYFDYVHGKYWFEQSPKDYPNVFFGHEVLHNHRRGNNWVALDGGCVFGQELRGFDSDTSEIVEVKSLMDYTDRSLR